MFNEFYNEIQVKSGLKPVKTTANKIIFCHGNIVSSQCLIVTESGRKLRIYYSLCAGGFACGMYGNFFIERIEDLVNKYDIYEFSVYK